MENLLGYLIKTGELIYFPNNEKLKERIFINPQILTQQIYRLIENNDFLKKNEGVFSLSHAAQDKLKEENWEALLELLISFNLVYKKIIQGKETYIAPQYLTKIPEFGTAFNSYQALKQERTLQFKLKYPRFLPENVMINVLSEYGPYASDVVYRNGIYFKKEDQTEGCVIEC